ncbi:MAG: hypothetical protein ACPLRN_00635 [Microgenomates group bacterium]
MKKYFFSAIALVILAILTGYLLSLKKINIPKFGQNQNIQQQKGSLNNQEFQPSIPTEQPVNQGLTIEVVEPKPNSVYKSSQIKVVGKTSPLAEVFVNDKQGKADNQGNFSINYQLDEGENLLTISASDQAGNYAEKEIVVNLQTIQ